MPVHADPNNGGGGGGGGNDPQGGNIGVDPAFNLQEIIAGAIGNALGQAGGVAQVGAAATNAGSPSGNTPGGGPGLPPGSSGGSGGSSGGSGGGMSAGAVANMRASYLEILRRWGLQVNPNLEKLVQRAISGMWSSTQFMQWLRKTPEYAEQFPGIQWTQGMSEAQYNAEYRAFLVAGQDVGKKIDRDQFGFLLKKGVERDEWEFRVAALDRLNQNADLFKNFIDVLKVRGLVKPGANVKKKDLFDFITGTGSVQWEKIWQEAAFTTGLESAGFAVTTRGGKRDGSGSPGDPWFGGPRFENGKAVGELALSRNQVLNVIRKVEGAGGQVENATTQDFVELAALVEQTLPLSQIYKEGITKTDLIQLKFGGPDAPGIALKVRRLMATTQAFEDEQRANPVFGATATGTALQGQIERGSQASE